MIKAALARFNNLRDRWFVGLVVVFNFVLQLSFITRSSIWHDEGYTLLLAPQDWGNIIARTARDVHPPAHYLTLNVWSGLFGTSELAVRALSAVFIAATLVIAFLLIKRLFGSGPARVTLLVMAVAPFLIRYGQEARMYAMAAFLLLTATYLLVRALDANSKKWLYLYALVMALAFYTHYYALFLVPVHWLYVLTRTVWRRHQRPANKLDLLSFHWWVANAAIVALFAPWTGAAYGQFTRVQAGFWIPPVDAVTLPNTILQFTAYTHFDAVAVAAKVAILLGLIALAVWAIAANPRQRASLTLLTAYAFTAPVAVWLISLLSRPVYIERYFVFAAVGFYMLIVVLLYVKPLNYAWRLRPFIIIGLLALALWGVRHVYVTSAHQMRAVGNAVSQRFETGDTLVAGELYVYLDFSYYNQTGRDLLLYAPGGVSGFGETSLLHDRTDQLVIESYNTVDPLSGYVWVIGKAGQKDYFEAVPDHWRLVERYQAGESVAHRYRIRN